VEPSTRLEAEEGTALRKRRWRNHRPESKERRDAVKNGRSD
jgi:hypothetical protein